MCGYITGTKKVLKSHGIRNLLTKQKHRGVDGYGAIALYADGTSLHNKYMASTPLINWVEALKGDPYVFIHHRATSVGGTILKLAHPLESNDTILMQNGTNKNPYRMVTLAESDSEALAILADIMEPEDFTDYILVDVGVIIFRKNDKFYLFKDDTRPLVIADDGLMCSEPLVEGNWEAVANGLVSINFSHGQLLGIKTFGGATVLDVGTTEYCSNCKKKHYTPAGGTVCNACVIEGVAQKKDYYRGSTSGNNYSIYDDDDYDDEYYGWAWKSGKYRRREEAGNTLASSSDPSTVTVLELMPTTAPEKGCKYIKKMGVPIKLGKRMYLVSGEKEDNVGTFLVKEVFLDKGLTHPYKNGDIPLANAIPKKMQIMDMTAYWDVYNKVYDLQSNVYYLEGELLSDEDKDLLVFDDYMNSYIIPYDYNYTPETYANWA